MATGVKNSQMKVIVLGAIVILIIPVVITGCVLLGVVFYSDTGNEGETAFDTIPVNRTVSKENGMQIKLESCEQKGKFFVVDIIFKNCTDHVVKTCAEKFVALKEEPDEDSVSVEEEVTDEEIDEEDSGTEEWVKPVNRAKIKDVALATNTEKKFTLYFPKGEYSFIRYFYEKNEKKEKIECFDLNEKE